MYIGSAVPPSKFLALPFEFAASPFHISKGDKSNLNAEQLNCMQLKKPQFSLRKLVNLFNEEEEEAFILSRA
ncbi:hypothetical protein VNO80_18911 [Phaseolus coccineus]|uniref:Uncharacterized protein n=1 Tax=Phaseolus coccineus TaxID=3886 RepID=A0AAN9R055_PHACN